MIALLGEEKFEKFQKVKSMLVGSGALGCEYLKMFAMMGMCTKGELKVVDDD